MKGFIDEKGKDRPACVNCVYKKRETISSPCYSCIDEVDLALQKPNHETEFSNFKMDGGDADADS